MIERIDWYGVIFIPATAVIVEAMLVGWQKSSLRRVVTDRSPSTRADLQYALFALLGGTEVLMRLSACGLLQWVEAGGAADIGLMPLRDLPGWLRYPLLFLAGNFIGYWQHRALHSRWLWPLHKVHHAPTEFTIVNVFRAHPIEYVSQAVTSVVGLGLLGFSPADIVVYTIVGAWFTTYSHSHLLGTWRLESLGIMTAAGHRLHHGVGPQHHDRNFGDMINLWDRLFGTYTAPGADAADIPLGVTDVGDRHPGHPLAAFAKAMWDCTRAVSTDIAGIARRSRSGGASTR
jgi:sterol desaturase/sphingolipid hydroxylase (fatty acid hydroxylase superfamily)